MFTGGVEVIVVKFEQRNLLVAVPKHDCTTRQVRSQGVSSPRFHFHTLWMWKPGSQLLIWSKLPIGRFIRHSHEVDLPPGDCLKFIGWP
jgi:hypothetical protein